MIDYPLILLAAGQSKRMGQPKGLLPFGPSTWITRQLRHYFSLGGNQVYLVLGADRAVYEEELHKNELQNVVVIENPDPSQGQFSSLKCALETFEATCFVSPLDVPMPELEVWEALQDAVDPGIFCVQPTFKDRGGHPVLISEEFGDQLCREGERLDHEIQKLHELRKRRVEVKDSSVCENINDPESWERWRASHAESWRPPILPE